MESRRSVRSLLATDKIGFRPVVGPIRPRAAFIGDKRKSLGLVGGRRWGLAMLSSIVLAATLSGCFRSPIITRAQLASINRDVASCTAATGKLTPLIAQSSSSAISYAAIDARNKCAAARDNIGVPSRLPKELDVCWRDVDAQERIAVAELSFLDDPTAARRPAILPVLNAAIGFQRQCSAALDRFRYAA